MRTNTVLDLESENNGTVLDLDQIRFHQWHTNTVLDLDSENNAYKYCF